MANLEPNPSKSDRIKEHPGEDNEAKQVTRQREQGSAAPLTAAQDLQRDMQQPTQDKGEQKTSKPEPPAPKASAPLSGANEVISEDSFSAQLRDSDPRSDHESKGLVKLLIFG